MVTPKNEVREKEEGVGCYGSDRRGEILVDGRSELSPTSLQTHPGLVGATRDGR